MIDRASIEELKSRVDIVDIVSHYIELKMSGVNYKANCPFHAEKTPSFVVSPDKQIFNCFGCGKGGDAIAFVKEYERLEYPEAIEKIAEIINFPLKYVEGRDRSVDSYKILNQVQRWYRERLSDSRDVNQYLKSRGLEQKSIDEFGVGYSGSSYELLDFLKRNLISMEEAKDVGVLSNRDGKFYARLTNRVTFPIHSHSGKLVGFGGRALRADNPAKYINSPQTKLFNKSKILYGYHLAKSRIYREGKIIVSEGYLDVILLHQAGFKNSVATLGTALTKEHIPLLRKGEPEVILAYDGDRAGIEAGFKASMLLSTSGIDGRVVLFPDGKDPADMVSDGDIDGLRDILNGGVALIRFTMESIINSYDLSNPFKKEKAFNEIKSYLSKLSEIVREESIPLASSLLGISKDIFYPKNRRGDRGEDEPRRVVIETNKCTDLGVLNILKTLIENPKMVDILDGVDRNYLFSGYRDIYDAIMEGELENPKVIKLIRDRCYMPLSCEELQRMVCNLLVVKYGTIKRKILHKRDIPYGDKEYIMRKITTDIIPNLKRGKILDNQLPIDVKVS
ncbi:MAG: DNA primase [Epsilonproteobacteria bacterium]|nr:DNA primase [Campylobacterota bacterium]